MRLFRIRYKLFLAIAGINAVIAAGGYLINNAAFQQGFSRYLGQQMLAQRVPLMGALVADYRRDGDWRAFQDNPRRFEALVQYYRPAGGPPSEPPPPRPRSGGPLGDDTPGREPLPGWMAPPPPRGAANLALLDAEHRIIIGPGRLPADSVEAPLLMDGRTVGWLAYIPQKELVDSAEKVFARQQQQIFARVGLGMLLSSALMAFGIAWWLNRPLRELTRGARALTEGQYRTLIAIPGRDELSMLARDFNTLAETLAANQAARQRWIADIAHELRTPLAILQGEIEALQDGIRQATPERLQSLGHEVRRLALLVDDLHTLSQSDEGALNYRKESVDLGQLIAGLVTSFRPRLERAGLSVELSAPKALMVHSDPARLTQLFANLMQNSLRYTDAPGFLRIAVQQLYNRIEVLWEDSSPGVPEKDLPHLTERLFRVETSRNRASGGSGLGLSIAKAIADAHDVSMRPRASALGGLCWELVFPLDHTES